MKSLTITSFEIIENNGRITISGNYTGTGYHENEIKKMIAAMLQSRTDKGDLNGNPDINKVTINANGNIFTGSDTL